jgi:hypothetical protein
MKQRTKTWISASVLAAFIACPLLLRAEVQTGAMSTQKIAFGSGGGGPTGVQVAGEFHLIHSDGFKAAPKRIAISVFNVAFPNEKFQSAESKRTTKWGSLSAIGTAMVNTLSEKKSTSQHTQIVGVDNETRQRIADAAYENFVAQLKEAGYDVVENAELAKLVPEYVTWTAQPNFSEGRFGTYVAPAGRKLFWLRSDTAKGDSQGNLNKTAAAFQGFDSPQAFQRSPYLAAQGKIGVLAVTLVVDYGTYFNTGDTPKFNAKMEVGFNPGVTVQSGSFYNTATLLEYWGPDSGGFPAVAALAAPLMSDLPFGALDNGGNGAGEVSVKADSAKFEQAAVEVTRSANAKLVSAFVNASRK